MRSIPYPPILPTYPDYSEQLPEFYQSLIDIFSHLVFEPNPDVQKELFSRLFAGTLLLYREIHGIKSETEAMRMLGALILQRSLRDIPYDEYLRTEHWRVTRMEALDRADHRCQLCHSTERLEVHHASYERLWHERPGDLIALCRKCHATFHGVGS